MWAGHETSKCPPKSIHVGMFGINLTWLLFCEITLMIKSDKGCSNIQIRTCNLEYYPSPITHDFSSITFFQSGGNAIIPTDWDGYSLYIANPALRTKYLFQN